LKYSVGRIALDLRNFLSFEPLPIKLVSRPSSSKTSIAALTLETLVFLLIFLLLISCCLSFD
jgi:hypothetical protein